MLYKISASSFISILLMTMVIYAAGVSAQTRSSSNYQLQSDSINIGGALGTSTSYELESTVGEIATGPSDSASFSLRAGYQQMQAVFLSLSGGANVTLSPGLPGVTGGEANGSTTFTVVTDSPAGYQLTILAEGNPAMQRGDGPTIDNYSPASVADFDFLVPAASAEFGFTPEGVDIVSDFQDNGLSCGIGSLDTVSSCWAGISTVATEIARGTGSNHPVGATTTIRYRAGVSSGAAIPEGVYTATTTITALPL